MAQPAPTRDQHKTNISGTLLVPACPAALRGGVPACGVKLASPPAAGL